MINRRNYYRILHVQPDAPREIIKASYRTLMQKLRQHPDLGGDHWNASLLNEAYVVLVNPEKRAAYDRQFLHKNKKTSEKTGENGDVGYKSKSRKNTGTRPHGNDKHACPFCGEAKPVLFNYSSSGDCNNCHSPLKPVVQPRLSGKPKRSLQRSLLNTPVQYFCCQNEMKSETGVVRDLSPNGMKFVTTRQLDKNQIIRITSSVLSAVARVIYCRQQHGWKDNTVGVQFLTLRFHEQTGILFSGEA